MDQINFLTRQYRNKPGVQRAKALIRVLTTQQTNHISAKTANQALTNYKNLVKTLISVKTAVALHSRLELSGLTLKIANLRD